MMFVRNQLISSSLATAIAELATLPICLVKTNYQNTNQNIPWIIKQIYSREGITGFYRASLSHHLREPPSPWISSNLYIL